MNQNVTTGNGIEWAYILILSATVIVAIGCDSRSQDAGKPELQLPPPVDPWLPSPEDQAHMEKEREQRQAQAEFQNELELYLETLTWVTNATHRPAGLTRSDAEDWMGKRRRQMRDLHSELTLKGVALPALPPEYRPAQSNSAPVTAREVHRETGTSGEPTIILGANETAVDRLLRGWGKRRSNRSTIRRPIMYYTKDVKIIVSFENKRAVGVAVCDQPGIGLSPIPDRRFREIVKLIGSEPLASDIKRSGGIREFSVGDAD